MNELGTVLCVGQYGRISEDIYWAVEPFISGGSLPDGSMEDLIRLIRSRLMP